jgi:hypothetical protein
VAAMIDVEQGAQLVLHQITKNPSAVRRETGIVIEINVSLQCLIRRTELIT